MTPPFRPRRAPLLTRVRPGSVADVWVMAAGLVFVVAVSMADWLTGPDVSLVIFYVLPVVAAAWLGRVRTGVILAVLVTTIGGAIAAADPGAATGAVWLWNAVIPFAFYLLVVWLVVVGTEGSWELPGFSIIYPFAPEK